MKQIQPPVAPAKPEPPATPPAEEVASPAKSEVFEKLIVSEPEPPKANVTPTETPVPEWVIPKPPTPPAIDIPAVASTAPAPPLPEKPPIVRSFTATPARVRKGQPVTLEWEVENLLAVTIDDLGEGLSPKNRGWVKPSKSTDYSLFDANNNPLSTVRVEVIKPDRSGIYGVLFALALLAIIYWFIRSSNSRDTAPKPKPKTEKTSSRKLSNVSQQQPDTPVEETATDTPEESDSEPVATVTDILKNEDTQAPPPAEEPIARTEPETKPASPADARIGKYEEAFGDKPYDKVELGADEMGWRRARAKGRWGYVNQNDEWVIQPEFEAITPFRGNTASVFLNGQLMTINRSGEQVRN
ncbi:WG repeat-containing protein [Spirosoma sp. KNUC1025]|uniref:WG repeat-containing protein n=1 Tax=Spirosoma sp. KNUC1025 TaxID=2894082 RepID=UPI003866FF50|nr:WG repeat-containing protein [Spirosoma sp. KNUC1025]